MSGAPDIGWAELGLTLAFVLVAGASSIALKLKLERDILWGTLRTVAQLFLMGFLLRQIFRWNEMYVVLPVFALMIFFAARIVSGRVPERGVPVFGPTFLSMLLTYMILAWFTVGILVRAEPWYHARYFIPLGGMIVGNSMNAIAVSLERLFSGIRAQRDRIELYLTLGATAREASAEIAREAVRAGMIPSISSMMGVGIVFIPGMMTGQIVAGADPLVAIKYQIMVMLMLTASTAAGSVIVVYAVLRKCFTGDGRIALGKG